MNFYFLMTVTEVVNNSVNHHLFLFLRSFQTNNSFLLSRNLGLNGIRKQTFITASAKKLATTISKRG